MKSVLAKDADICAEIGNAWQLSCNVKYKDRNSNCDSGRKYGTKAESVRKRETSLGL